MRFFSCLLFFILMAGTSYAKYDLVICAIFQDEAPYLKEWIEFHKIQGVKHFYLYNNSSQDEYLSVLKDYIDNKQVTLIDWLYAYDYADHKRWIEIQSGAYMDCVKNYGAETDWIAAIDIDEFLFCPSGQTLPSFLKSYRSYGGLAVNWIRFGTSNIQEIPSGTLMIEALTRCSSYTDRDNRTFKTIAQPKYVADCKSAHEFTYVKGKCAVNIEKRKTRWMAPKILLNDIRINHYWTRTEKYLWEHKIAGRLKRRKDFPQQKILDLAAKCNVSEDKAILIFADQLRKAMGYR